MVLLRQDMYLDAFVPQCVHKLSEIKHLRRATIKHWL
jgi:hypothetical protein